MLSEEQIKAALAKYNDKTKLGTDEEAATATKQFILELGRISLGLPADRENKAADKATLHIVGKWKSENPDLSFWESFFSRFSKDPVKAIKYLEQRREDKSAHMKGVRNSPNRNRPSVSRSEIESLLRLDPDQGPNNVWHRLRKSPLVDEVSTLKARGEFIVFIDEEKVPSSSFRQRVYRIKKAMKETA